MEDRPQPYRFTVNTPGTTPASCAHTNKGNMLGLTYSFGFSTDNGCVLSPLMLNERSRFHPGN